jgi:hypothetical protein
MAFDLPISRPARRRLEKVVPNLRELNLGDTGTPTPTQPPDTGGGNWFQDALSTARRAGEMAGGFGDTGFGMIGRPEPPVMEPQVPISPVQPASIPSGAPKTWLDPRAYLLAEEQSGAAPTQIPGDMSPENLEALMTQPSYQADRGFTDIGEATASRLGPEEDTFTQHYDSSIITLPIEFWHLSRPGDPFTMEDMARLERTDPEKAEAIRNTPIPGSELKTYESLRRNAAYREHRGMQDAIARMGPIARITSGEDQYEDWMQSGVYHVVHGVEKAQTSLGLRSPTDLLQTKVESIMGTEVPVQDPRTGRPILAAITDVSEFSRNGGALHTPTALSVAKEMNILPWYITEPIKLLIDPLNFFPVVGWQVKAARTAYRVKSGVSAGVRGMVQLNGSQGARQTKDLVDSISTDPYMQSPFVRPITTEIERRLEIEKRIMAGEQIPQRLISGGPTPDELGLATPESMLPTTARVAFPQAEMVPTQYPPAVRVEFPGAAQETGIIRELTEPGIKRAGPLADETQPLWERRALYPTESQVYRNMAASAGKPGRVGGESMPVEMGRIMAGGIAEIVSPDQVMIHAPSIARQLFNLTPYRAGLTNTETVKSLIKGSIPGKARGTFNIVKEDIYGTALGRTHNDNAKKVNMYATAYSRTLSDTVLRDFPMDTRGHIDSLAGWDDTLQGVAPTIQDVAARLPVYWAHLSPEQQKAMLGLKDFSKMFEDALDESGSKYILDHPRLDVVTDPVRDYNNQTVQDNAGRALTGFYLHRGTSKPVREERRVRVEMGPRFPTKPGFAHEATFDSMAQGIEGVVDADGVTTAYEYVSFRRAMYEYVRDVGTSINKAHAANYTLALSDPETGVLQPLKATRVNPELQKKVSQLKAGIKRGGDSLKKKAAQSTILRREIGRYDTAYAAAEKRMEARLKQAGARVTVREGRLVTSELNEYARWHEMMDRRFANAASHYAAFGEPQDLLGVSMRDAYELSFQAGQALKDVRKGLAQARRLNRKEDLAVKKSLTELDELQSAVRQAEEKMMLDREVLFPEAMQLTDSYHDYYAHVRVSINKLQDKTDELVDNWVKSLDELEDAQALDKTAREIVELRNDTARLRRRKELDDFRAQHTSKMLQREIDLAKLEESRLGKVLQREVNIRGRELSASEQRLLNNDLQAAKVRSRIDGYQEQLNELQDEYLAATGASGRPPVDHDIVPLPGLGGYYWPDAFAQAARQYLKKDPSFAGEDARPFYMAWNSMYRAARGTLDNSAMFVHLLLRFYDNPAAWQRAMRFSIQAWGVPKSEMIGIAEGRGERAIDSFFRNFDDAAGTTGRMTSSQWASHGLAITGADTEMALGRFGFGDRAVSIGNLPFIKQANRAFGAAGDAARLEWADDYLAGMLRKHTMEELVARGDLEKIASSINSATGWSTRRFGGDLGDLLFFAPRFLMARMETLTKALIGTPSVLINPIGPYGRLASVDQRMAAKSMMKMIGTGVMLIEGANMIQGHETDWRPVVKINEGTPNEQWVRNTNFARIRTPWGTDISPFGTYDSLLGFFITSALVTEGGGPHEAVRTMASGVVTNIWDLLTGQDGIGNPTGTGGESTDWARLAQYAMGNFIPFTADDLPRLGKDMKEDLVSGNPAHALGRFTEFMTYGVQGGKSSPLSQSEQRNELRQDRLSELDELGLFDDLPDLEQDAVRTAIGSSPWDFRDNWWGLGQDVRDTVDTDTLIAEKTAEIEDNLRKKGSKKQVLKDERERLRDIKIERIEAAWQATGERPTENFRNEVRKANASYRDGISALEGSDEFRDYLAGTERLDSPDAILDDAVDQMMDIFTDPSLTAPDGIRDYREIDRRMRVLENELGPDLIRRAQAQLDKNDHPGETEIRELQDTLRLYWEAAEVVEQSFANVDSFQPVEKQLLSKYLEAQEGNQKAAASMYRLLARSTGSTIITDYDSVVSAVREGLRDAKPEIDAALQRGEYSASPRTAEGAVELTQGALEQMLRDTVGQ